MNECRSRPVRRPDTRHTIRIVLLVIAASLALLALSARSAAASSPLSECSTGPDVPTGVLALVAGSGEAYGGSEVETYTVEVEVGLGLDNGCLTAAIETVLGDPRSWIHEGNLGWQKVDSSPDMQITFASPDLTDQLCAPLATGGIYSCRNGDRVVLNVYRWREGTLEYANDLDEYRRYLINHEVGHWLGNGHVSCPAPGALAPVMAQQTKGLDGCVQNGWPYPAVFVPPEVWDGTFWDDDGSAFEADIEWAAAAGITFGCNPPENNQYCPADPVTRGQMAAFLDRALELPATGAEFFSDDDGSTFEDSINRLAASGITTGCDETSFCPGDTITRAQMAAFLHRALPDLPLGEPLARHRLLRTDYERSWSDPRPEEGRVRTTNTPKGSRAAVF